MIHDSRSALLNIECGVPQGSISYIYRKIYFLSFKEKKMFCSALIQPRFDSGCNTWFRNLECGLKLKLQTAQNKLMRLILGVHPRLHIGHGSFNKLKWFPEELIFSGVTSFQYLSSNSTIIHDDVSKTADTHKYYTCKKQESKFCLTSCDIARTTRF